MEYKDKIKILDVKKINQYKNIRVFTQNHNSFLVL